MDTLPPPAEQTCIVVPAYNEAARLDVAALEAYLHASTNVRLLFVNDGSGDGTLALLRSVEHRWPTRVAVLDLKCNSGKAEAVRRGILAAAEDPGLSYVGFWDADWATPLGAVDAFVHCLQSHPTVELVLGARVALLGRAIVRKAHRHYLGRVAATFASLVLGLPVYDTQCGAKLMRLTERTKSLFTQPFESGWVFDVELLARYLRVSGSSAGIYELPLDAWRDVGDSKVRPVDFLRSFGHMAKIYRRYKLPQRYHFIVDLITAPFARYASAGALGTVTHYVVLPVSVEGLGIQAWIGSAIGATCGALVNYTLNYHFVFASRRPHRNVLPKFLTIALAGIGLNALLVHTGTKQLGVHYLVAQLIATGVGLGIGFLLNKLWTFKE